MSSIQSDVRQIRLSRGKEPGGLGWVSRVPEGNKIPVMFSIGDQTVIDEWYKRVRKPFGVMEFTAAPIAVHPTLTIFVENDIVNLDELEIPDNIEVSRGYVPMLFHRFNTTLEKELKDKAAAAKRDQPPPKLDPASEEIERKINELLGKPKVPVK